MSHSKHYTPQEIAVARKLIRLLPLQVKSTNVRLEGNLVRLARKEYSFVRFTHFSIGSYWNFLKNNWSEKTMEESVASMVRALYA